MYIYAEIAIGSNIVQNFIVSDMQASEEELEYLIPVDAVHENWILRKRWNASSQTWEDVLPSEADTRNSLEFTHIDTDGVKHWLDDYVNGLSSGGSVETATVSEVETYLGI